jgi:hypothetical protein
MRARLDFPLWMLALAAALAATAGAARADVMSACAPEVGQYCGTVTEGRGRVMACLASHTDKLSAACRPEVQAMASSRLVPGHVRRIFDPGFHAAIPAACQTAAAQLCSGVVQGDGRVFACLYAFTDRVGADCTEQAQAALKAN